MLDREFVTRFLAFYINSPTDYIPDLDNFLNNTMSQLGSLSIEEREKVKANFIKAMITAYKIFGNWAFRKADLYPDRRKPINKALFEVWSVCLAKLSKENRITLINRKEEVIARFVEICEPHSPFWYAISSSIGKKSGVIERFKTIENLIAEVLSGEAK